MLVDGRKVCGILIQNSLSGKNIQNSVVGIGMNVNQQRFSAALPRAGSLALITGRTYDLNEVLTTLFSHLESRYLQLKQGRWPELQTHYLEQLFQRDEEKLYAYPDGDTFRGTIRGVAADGKLMIDTGEGRLRSFAIKEIKYILE